MQMKIKQRLQDLRKEYESGQEMLADLETRRANLQQTVLRISGAIQVLEELLESEEASAKDDGGGEITGGLPVSQLEQETGG